MSAHTPDTQDRARRADKARAALSPLREMGWTVATGGDCVRIDPPHPRRPYRDTAYVSIDALLRAADPVQYALDTFAEITGKAWRP